jgi:hypothetical protein
MTAIKSSQPEEVADEIEFLSKHTTHRQTENESIAKLLEEISQLLSDQGATEFRVRAYQQAGKTLSTLSTPVRRILEQEGIVGLIDLPTIGNSIANLIEQYIRLGRIPLLDRLRGEEVTERLFATLPSIGPELSHRIHEHLQIETLPELYAAALDGRLAGVPGIGKKRVQAIREVLAERLLHRHVDAETSHRQPADHSVSVAELLDVDEEYRRLADEGKLLKIAPRQFNPGASAWLPILHTERGGRHYTVLYSNTARAHELNTIKDWVVIYRDDAKSDGRWTVITSQFGRLRGRRIVRGREDECWQYYQDTTSDGLEKS